MFVFVRQRQQRAWLLTSCCLLLLLLAACIHPAGSDTAANVATLDDAGLLDSDIDSDDGSTEDDNLHLLDNTDDKKLLLGDDQLDDASHGSASEEEEVVKNADAAAPSQRILNNSIPANPAAKPAFLRKQSTTAAAATAASPTTENAAKLHGKAILHKAFQRAVGGGIPGAVAGIVQVLSLMWLRTVINYQYRYGSSFVQALTTLYGMGGIPRLYSGVHFALIQAPLSRFVSTAANDGVSVLLQNFHWGPGREVVVAAFFVGFFRMMLMPIDTCKTVMQIEGSNGLTLLMSKVRKGKFNLLYSGALANAASSFVGHYPWFYTYNLLSNNETLQRYLSWTTGRNALVGFVSSIVSDTVANFMRVIKTTKQSLGSTRSETSYAETISLILAVDGWRGLFGRGLKTRILGNALQSILFTVVWRGLSERWSSEKTNNVEDGKDEGATGEGGTNKKS